MIAVSARGLKAPTDILSLSLPFIGSQLQNQAGSLNPGQFSPQLPNNPAFPGRSTTPPNWAAWLGGSDWSSFQSPQDQQNNPFGNSDSFPSFTGRRKRSNGFSLPSSFDLSKDVPGGNPQIPDASNLPSFTIPATFGFSFGFGWLSFIFALVTAVLSGFIYKKSFLDVPKEDYAQMTT